VHSWLRYNFLLDLKSFKHKKEKIIMKNKIDVAVLGLGGMGSTHVGAAKASPYVDKIYGYEPDAERAALRGKELEIEATSDIDAIMHNPAIKLIYIASINGVHSEQAIRAMRAGKSVLCEKPMGETLAEAQEMIEVQQETGQFLQIGFELHYSKIYMQAKQWIDEGLIGTPVNCHCRYYCSEFHNKNSWRSNSTGTLIGEKLSHYLDLQRWFIGSPVEEVFSMNAPNVVDYFNHSDNHQINLRFTNGAAANLNFVMYIAESDHRDPLLEMLEKQSDDGHSLTYYIFGTKGAIETDVFRRRIRRWEFTDGPERLESAIAETITYDKAEDQIWIHNTHGQNLRIAELVATGMAPENPVTDSFETMKVGFAAEISERERRIVKLSELS
jgi:predicted dehydrogenase